MTQLQKVGCALTALSCAVLVGMTFDGLSHNLATWVLWGFIFFVCADMSTHKG